MAAPLLELSEVLHSRSVKDNRLLSERRLINNCMVKAVKNFFVGAFTSFAIVYSATSKIGRWYSFSLSAGSAMITGRLVAERTADACVAQILSIQGSWMQRELANIILRNYREHPLRMQLVYKYFYPERVFTDRDPDKLTLRWRVRNDYVDGTASQRNESHEDCSDHAGVVTVSSRQSNTNLGGDLLADPLDCILGMQEPSEEIQHADARESSRRQQRYKSGHRRRRHHHHHHIHHAP